MKLLERLVPLQALAKRITKRRALATKWISSCRVSRLTHTHTHCLCSCSALWLMCLYSLPLPPRYTAGAMTPTMGLWSSRGPKGACSPSGPRTPPRRRRSGNPHRRGRRRDKLTRGRRSPREHTRTMRPHGLGTSVRCGHATQPLSLGRQLATRQ